MYTNSLKSYFYSTTFHNFVTQSGRLNRLTLNPNEENTLTMFVWKRFVISIPEKVSQNAKNEEIKEQLQTYRNVFIGIFFFDIDTHWRPHGKRDSFLPSAITNANFWYFDDFSKIKVFHFSIASWILWSSHSFWEVFYNTRTFYFKIISGNS